MAKSEALQAKDVVVSYGGVPALDGLSLAVRRGECVAMVGESGSGKTTLLRCFNRMVEPDRGVIRVAGRDVRSQPPIELRRSLGYVQQEGGLLPHWRVGRNASLVPWLRGFEDAEERGRQALERVGLEPGRFALRWPHELSGGQRQRVAIARALAADPAVVLLDEPFGALDAITRSELQQAFDRLRRALGMTVLLVTHDLIEARRLADRIAVLKDGRLRQLTTPTELVERPADDYVRELVATAGLGAA
jgi:osmoprotectant transport system ATP-binding protein